MPTVRRLDHANLVVRDLTAATAFYCDVLGLRVVLSRRLEEPWIAQVVGCPGAVMDCVILEAPAGGARLELLSYVHPRPLAVAGHELPFALGLRHLAFDVDDLDAVLERLRAAGVAPLSEPATVPFAVAGQRKRLVYFRDADGVLLELAEYAPWEAPMDTLVKVPDMMCGSCAAKIREALAQVAGVQAVECDVAAKTVTVRGAATAAAIATAIRTAGFTPAE